MKEAFLALLLVAALVIGITTMGGCNGEDREAQRKLADAQAYEIRQQADTAAAAERAAIREAARQAGHERAMELLPVLILIVGGLALAFVCLLLWSTHRTDAMRYRQDASPALPAAPTIIVIQSGAPPPPSLDLTPDMCRAIALAQRRGQVTVYPRED